VVSISRLKVCPKVPRQVEHLGAPLPGGPEVRHERELRRLAVHVQRVLEQHGGELLAHVQVLEQGGHLEVDRVDLP
jgi:hypothetical protein